MKAEGESFADEREAGAVDRLLLPFLLERDEPTSEDLLGQLATEHAQPVIEKIVRSKLRVSLKPSDGSHLNQDAMEICGDVQAQVLNQLRAVKEFPDRKTINNFRSYVAVITYNACSEYLRRKHPERSRLKNRLRYLLTHQPALALWEGEEQELLCGLAAWRGQKSAGAFGERLHESRHDPQFLADERLRSVGDQAATAPTVHSLTAIFERAGSAVELDELVNAVSDLYGIKDQTSLTEDDADEREDALEKLPDAKTDVATEVEQRMYLQRLWAEVCQLLPRQRAAILLNLRDAQGRGMIALFPLLRIASMRQIAVALDLGAEEFANLWNDLPLEDAGIASLLGVTRQQVINLRKSARERLARRMKGF
jgi:DNA-directed RNA polymerase specialized sigma24 family protein